MNIPDDVIDKDIFLIHNAPDIPLEQLFDVDFQILLQQANTAMRPIIEALTDIPMTVAQKTAYDAQVAEIRQTANEHIRAVLPHINTEQYRWFSFIFPVRWLDEHSVIDTKQDS